MGALIENLFCGDKHRSIIFRQISENTFIRRSGRRYEGYSESTTVMDFNASTNADVGSP
jgi:hypothetical protein